MLNHLRIALIVAIVLAFGMALLEKTGEYLVMDHPAHADVIVVLAGDRNDCRFFAAYSLHAQHVRDLEPLSDELLLGHEHNSPTFNVAGPLIWFRKIDINLHRCMLESFRS